MLDIAILATTVVAKILGPFLQKGASAVADAVTEKFGKPAADHVITMEQQLLDKVGEVFTAPNEQKALDLFKEEPAELQGMIEKILKQKLEANPDLAGEFQKLVESKGPTGQTGAQVMNASGVIGIIDNRGATIWDGVQIGAVGGAVNTTPTVPDFPTGGTKQGGSEP
jgi:hypothetical protein